MKWAYLGLSYFVMLWHTCQCVILSDDKDSSKVIMNKKDHNRKTDDMINEGRQQGKYRETDDNILKELE